MITIRTVAATGLLLASNYVMFQLATTYAEQIAQAKAIAGQVEDVVTPAGSWGIETVKDHPLAVTGMLTLAGLGAFGRWMVKEPKGLPSFDYIATIKEVLVSDAGEGRGLYRVIYDDAGGATKNTPAYGPANLAPDNKVLLRTPILATNYIVQKCVPKVV